MNKSEATVIQNRAQLFPLGQIVATSRSFGGARILSSDSSGISEETCQR